MKKILGVITIALLHFNFTAIATCPKIDKDGISSFLVAIKGADYKSRIKRYTFKYKGYTWFLESGYFNFLTQKDFDKRFLYDLVEIKFDKSSTENKKLRCHYKSFYKLIYQDDPDLKHEYNFHMTRIIQ